MRIAIISDIHGNLEAFYKVVKSIRNESVDQIVFLGDIGFMGLYPQECFDLLQDLSPSICIRGNTDTNFLETKSFKPVNKYEEKVLMLCNYMESNLCQKAKNQILTWHTSNIFEKFDNRFIFCHGSPYSNKDIIKIENINSYFDRIKSERVSHIFFGHTHACTQFMIGLTKMINAGSIGYSLDGDTSAKYGIIDISSDGELNFFQKKIPYESSRYIKQLKKVNFPLKEELIFMLNKAKCPPKGD